MHAMKKTAFPWCPLLLQEKKKKQANSLKLCIIFAELWTELFCTAFFKKSGRIGWTPTFKSCAFDLTSYIIKYFSLADLDFFR